MKRIIYYHVYIVFQFSYGGDYEKTMEKSKETSQQRRYRDGESVELRGKNAGSAQSQKIDVKNTPDRETRKP